MPSPESPTFNAAPATNGELAGETPRQTYEIRGETTLKAEHEQRERELLEERARIMDRLQVLNAEIAKSKQKLGIQNISEQGQNPVTLEGSEEPENSPAEMGTPVAPVAPGNPTGSETARTQPIPTEPESEPVQDTTGNANPATGETGANDPETQPSPEDIQNTINKTKKNKGFKKVIIAAAAVAMAGIMTAGAWLGINAFNKNNKSNNNPDRPSVTDVVDASSAIGESHEVKGIYDGYGEKGMWLSENKGGSYDFASAREAAEVCDNDECEMIKYTAHNQVESYADYIANLPEELQPEGFKGLTILETEKKLEGLSDEEYEAIEKQFGSNIDKAFTREVTLNGDYHNSYMRLIDPSKPATHDNMELVECTTHENGTKAVEMYWTDDGTANGNIIGTMTVKIVRDDNGDITGGCLQVVNPVGSHSNLYNGMPDVTENPPTTTPETTPPTTPPETMRSKDAENLKRIDKDILDQVAEEIMTGEVRVTPNPGVNEKDLTDKPSSDAYQGTSPDVVQNDTSENAEQIQDQVSSENSYSQNLGGANSGEYSPVQDDQSAQAFADFNAIPVSEATVSGTDLQDILGDVGIN